MSLSLYSEFLQNFLTVFLRLQHIVRVLLCSGWVSSLFQTKSPSPGGVRLMDPQPSLCAVVGLLNS